MSTPRRFYIYAVSAISLNAFVWAIISLLRDLAIAGFAASTESVAFQIAVNLIGVPIFLVHWFWAQRLSRQDEEERGAVLRRVYLYGTQAGFLIPIVDSAFALISTLFFIPTGRVPRYHYPPLSSGESILYYLLALVILLPVWFFQYSVNKEDEEHGFDSNSDALIRRLFVLAFSGAGLIMTTVAIISLLRWFLFQIGGDGGAILSGAGPAEEVARLIVGLPLWLIFWMWAGRLFEGPDEEERASALRKFYLYLTVFGSAMATVTSIAFILEGFFRRILGVPSFGGSQDDVRVPVSVIVGSGLVWAYHAFVIRDDAEVAKDLPHQRGIRRLHRYLIATIGLAAFLVGLSGDLSVVIRAIEEVGLDVGLKRELSWFAALTIAGLPVWFLPWQQFQTRAELPGEEGSAERRSSVRKGYLYFFIFVATMAVLSSVVFLVFKFLSMLFGEPAPSISELGQPIAFSLIAVGVWLFHGSALRGDGQRAREDQAARFEDAKVVVLDIGDGTRLREMAERINKEIPVITPISIPLSKDLDPARESVEMERYLSQIQKAKVIVGPWVMAVAGWGDGMVRPEIAQAIFKSPAEKVLIPTRAPGWDWAGVDLEQRSGFVNQAARAVRQILEGENVEPPKSLGAGAIVAIVIGVLILLGIVGLPLLYFLLY